jgi:hypothetical protein
MIRNISDWEKINLDYFISKCLKKVIQGYLLAKKGTKLQEPDYIMALSLDLPRRLRYVFKSFLNEYLFSVTGIFCHQKPFVKMLGETISCEIGDLLLVYIHTDVQGKKYYNSLLLQAKISEKENKNISPGGDQRQFRLYSEWPKFIYARTNKLKGTGRDIMPKVFTGGAKYMLIDPDPNIVNRNNPLEYIFGTAHAHKPLILTNRLSLELIDFIGFKAGRTFEGQPAGDEWSKLIWDLILVTKGSKARRKNIGLGDSGFDRATTAGQCLYFSQYKDDHSRLTLFDDIDDNNGNNDIPNERPNDEFGGMSMVIIESQEQERVYNRQ